MGIRQTLRHVLNPLHVFCRLRALGLSKRASLRLAHVYERYLFFVLVATPPPRRCILSRAARPSSRRSP